MKMFSIGILNLLLFFFLSCQSIENHQASDTKGPVKISLNTGNQYSFKNDFLGVIMPSLFTAFSLDDTLFTKDILKTGFSNFQFPGGILSHWNHYKPNGDGYNINLDEVKKYDGEASWMNKDIVTNERDFFEETLRFCKTNKKVLVLTANLFTGTISELKYALTRCKEENVNAKVVLGVELQIASMHKYFPSGNTYCKTAAEYINMIRKNFPEVEIAADGANLDAGKKEIPFRSEWNSEIAKLDFDAIALYQYAKLNKILSSNDVESIFKEANSRLTDYVNNGFQMQIEQYKQYFGDKPIWIVQSGIDYHETKFIIGNTITSAMYDADYYLWCAKFNALNNNSLPIVEYTKLASNNVGVDVFTHSFPQKEKAKDDNNFVKRTPFFVFNLISPISQDSVNFVPATIANIDTTITHIYSFIKNEHHYIYIVNKGASLKIDQIEVDGKAIHQNLEAKLIHADQLTASCGFSYWQEMFPNNEKSEIQIEEKTMLSDSIEIPAYSITRIEF